MLKQLLALSLFVLVGCDQRSTYEQKLDTAVPERTEILVKVHLYQSSAELEKVAGTHRFAMSKWSPNDNICDIWVKQGDTKSLGHEMQHCIFGSWHPE